MIFFDLKAKKADYQARKLQQTKFRNDSIRLRC